MNAVAMPAVRIHQFSDGHAWAEAIADRLANRLTRAIAEHGRGRILLSGGGTPAPAYRALARRPLDWSRIDIGLVDERWLPPDDPNSNAWLIRTHLLDAGARAARFLPLVTPGTTLANATRAANREAGQRLDAIVLGMGLDGHTASLFPNMRGLEDALACQSDYIAVDAEGCSGAGRWIHRISLTPAALARAETSMLLIRSEAKRALLQRALAQADVSALPIRIASMRPATPLDVYWAP